MYLNNRVTIKIFITALLLNLPWEIWHSRYYAGFMGKSVPAGLLVLASIIDAFIILGIFLIASDVKGVFKIVFPAMIGGLIAIVIEKFALTLHLWEYSSLMPMVPVLHIGLTPFVQMLVLPPLTLLLHYSKYGKR